MNGPPDLILFFGRLHPLLVHLPIGLIVLVAALELLARVTRFSHANRSVGIILALAAPLAAGTALCGWLLSLGGGYERQLLWWHKWAGIGTAAACLMAGLLYRLAWHRAYLCCLALTLPVLVVASHFGGSLTHGSDYLVRYAPGPVRALLGARTPPPPGHRENRPRDWTSLDAFADVVQPVLQKDCVGCHGPDKAKGGLRLDSLAAALQGGKAGPAIVPGKPAQSELLRRLGLPLGEDDHMPPEGKPQPGPEDVALLQWWVAAGAPAGKTAGSLKPPADIARLLAARCGAPPPVAKAVPPKPLEAVAPLAAQLSEELGVALGPIAPPEPWLQCNAAIAHGSFGDAQLARLAPLAANLRWLDLAGTKVTDSGLGQVEAMPNLVRLHLEQTAVTDAGLEHLAHLENLESLDLYGTAVTDSGLQPLQKLPRLKRLFLWQSRVTPAAAKAFAANRTDKDQIQRWRDEIEQIKAKIKDQEMLVDLGAAPSAPATNATPLNARCPVSGKPIDPAKTVVFEGRVVAFCCDDCKARFEKDPKPFLAKLGRLPRRPRARAGRTGET